MTEDSVRALPTIKSPLLPILGMLTLLVFASEAQAQSEAQHHRDMVDIAATPPQSGGNSSDEGPDTYRAPSRPSKPGFMAMAYHVDTASVWTSVAHNTLSAAKGRALEGCNAATGGGCYVVAAIEGTGRISVAEDAMGQLWIKGAVGNDMLTPVDPAVQHCARNSFGCHFLGVHDSGRIYLDEDPNIDQSEDYFPKGQLHRNRWAMVAQPTSSASAAEQNRSWLISGKDNSAAARKELLERCQSESGVSCAIAAVAVADGEVVTQGATPMTGALVHFVDATGKSRWTSAVIETGKMPKKRQNMQAAEASGPITVQDRIGQQCAQTLPCRIMATYDAATPRFEVIAGTR